MNCRSIADLSAEVRNDYPGIAADSVVSGNCRLIHEAVCHGD
jgi:hypothetical protein